MDTLRDPASAVVRAVGRRRVPLPRLLFGTAPLATVFWGNDEATAVAAVGRALDLGVRGFDTAPLYGLGEAEAAARAGAGRRGPSRPRRPRRGDQGRPLARRARR